MNETITLMDFVVGAAITIAFFHWAKYVFLVYLGLVLQRQPETVKETIGTALDVFGISLLLGTFTAIAVLVPELWESKLAAGLAERYAKR